MIDYHSYDSDRKGYRVTIDSREVAEGDLFVALPGERVDGQAFVADARAGAETHRSPP